MLYDFYFLFDYAVLGLRILVAIVFFSSGRSHIAKPRERGESMGLSPMAATLLGLAEIIGAISVAAGIYIQVGAILLIITMLGAIYKKIFVWKTGFYSSEGFGWHYDAILLLANLVFLAEGGRFVLIG